MGRFPSAAHLVSWAKFCPQVHESAGRRKPKGRGKGNPWLAGTLGNIVATAARTDSFLGARYRRIAKRRGKQKAIVATGNSVLVIVYHLLADSTATFVDLGGDHYQSVSTTNAGRAASPANSKPSPASGDVVRSKPSFRHQRENRRDQRPHVGARDVERDVPSVHHPGGDPTHRVKRPGATAHPVGSGLRQSQPQATRMGAHVHHQRSGRARPHLARLERGKPETLGVLADLGPRVAEEHGAGPQGTGHESCIVSDHGIPHL